LNYVQWSTLIQNFTGFISVSSIRAFDYRTLPPVPGTYDYTTVRTVLTWFAPLG